MNNMLRRENDFDLFDVPFFAGYEPKHNLMKTDIREEENDYVIEIEVPGIKKEDIKISLDNDQLVVNATVSNKEEKEKKKYLHKERFYGSYTRSYYVGNINQKDIKAAFENGILTITFPKDSKVEDETKYIAID